MSTGATVQLLLHDFILNHPLLVLSWRSTEELPLSKEEYKCPLMKKQLMQLMDSVDPFSLSVCGQICHHDRIATVLDTVLKPYRCLVEIKMKAEVKDGCSAT